MTVLCNKDTRYALSLYKSNLSFLSVWPLRENGIIKTIHAGLIFFSQVSIAIPQYIDLVYNWSDWDKTIENLTSNVMINMMIIKLVTLHFHRENLAACVRSVIADWERDGDNERRIIMKRHCAFGRIVFIGLSTMLYSSYLMYIVLAIVVTATTDCSAINSTEICKAFPLPANYVIDSEVSPLYELLFLLQIVQGMISTAGNSGIDAFMFAITMHLCGQLEILKIEFRTMQVRTYKERIVSLAKRHCELIGFSGQLQDTFNIMLLAQLFVSSVLICLVGFQFILCLENGDVLAAGKYTFYVIAIMMQLFLYSYAGDYLTNQSLDLVYATYESPWYDLPSNVSRDLLFVMVRAGYPLRISAGKFFFMTLENFTVIVKTSVSYLSVLRVLVI